MCQTSGDGKSRAASAKDDFQRFHTRHNTGRYFIVRWPAAATARWHLGAGIYFESKDGIDDGESRPFSSQRPHSDTHTETLGSFSMLWLLRTHTIIREIHVSQSWRKDWYCWRINVLEGQEVLEPKIEGKQGQTRISLWWNVRTATRPRGSCWPHYYKQICIFREILAARQVV